MNEHNKFWLILVSITATVAIVDMICDTYEKTHGVNAPVATSTQKDKP